MSEDQVLATMTIPETSLIDIKVQSSSMVKSPDEKYLLIGTRDGEILKFDIQSRSVINRISTELSSLWSIAITKDQCKFFTASAKNIIVEYDFSNFAYLRNLDGHTDEVNCLALSESNSFLYSVGDDKTVRKWNLADKVIVSEVLYDHPGIVYALDVSIDEKFVATGCAEKNLIIYALDSKQLHVIADKCSERIWCVKFTFDRKYLISGDQSSVINIWSYGDWVHQRVLKGHTDRVRCMEISKDSKKLYSGSLDKNIVIWNLEELKAEKVLKGHSDWVKAISVSDNGENLYSTGDDRTVAIWNLNSNPTSIWHHLKYWAPVLVVAVAVVGIKYFRNIRK